ncbi:MAG: hemerythrin family protein [Deltaproteobacteria bacterium]|nr:hemerythrin family protein [Deltaproteobacteria bacterium]
MAFMKWSTNLSVNVAEIDSQHQHLVNFINDLSAAMKEGKGKDSLAEIITGLVLYAKTHFATEEKYFDKFGYPETFSHKQEHNMFIEKVTEFKNDFDNGSQLLSVPILSFLRDWLVNHINVSDMKYSGFFNEKGLS